MFSPFTKSSLIGLDLNMSEITMLELGGKQGNELQHIASMPLPADFFADGLVRSEAQLHEVLKALFKQAKTPLKGRRLALALGGASVIIRLVNLPNNGEADLTELIELEAEQHFQHDLNDLYFTWQVLDTPGDADSVAVILVGAKKKIVDHYIKIFKKSGCRVRVIDCEVFAQLNALAFCDDVSEGLIALVNIGAQTSQVTFLDRGRFLYSRDFAFGVSNYVNSVGEALNISPEQALSLLHAARDNPATATGALLDTLTFNNEQFAAEIQLTIDFFFQSAAAPPTSAEVQKLYLSGGAAYYFGLEKAVQERVVAATSIINPLEKLTIPKQLSEQALLHYPAQFSTALGLALRSDNDSE